MPVVAERQVMEQIIKTESGVRIQIKDGIVSVTSKSGDTTCYDVSGELWRPVSNFFFMGEPERELVKEWIKNSHDERISTRFYQRVEKALSVIDYDYQISVMEPSMDIEGYVYFREGHDIVTGLTLWDYRELAEEFYDPELEFYDEEWISSLSTDYELTLWYAWRCAAHRWSLRSDCKLGKLLSEKVSGRNKYGFADGINNTLKVTDASGYYAVCGPCSEDGKFDFSRPEYFYDQDLIVKNATLVVVLKKK